MRNGILVPPMSTLDSPASPPTGNAVLLYSITPGNPTAVASAAPARYSPGSPTNTARAMQSWIAQLHSGRCSPGARWRVSDVRHAWEIPVTDQDQISRHYNVEVSALVRVFGEKVHQQICQLRGMSLGGTFIELGRLSPGTQVNITFGVPTLGEKLSIDAVVYWSTEQGAGVQFEGMRARQVWALWRYLESVAGDEPDTYYETVEILTN